MEASLASWGSMRRTKEASHKKCKESGRTFHPSFPAVSAFTLTDVPGDRVAAFYLRPPDDIPDAGHPVSQQSKRRHEQRQNHGAVLGVTIQLLQQAQQSEQTDRFQQVHQGRLEGGSEKLSDVLLFFKSHCSVLLQSCY